jgi:hypothetical protein
MWKCHVVYESRPHSVIITLGGQLYRVLEVVPTTVVSLISKVVQKGGLSDWDIFPLYGPVRR